MAITLFVCLLVSAVSAAPPINGFDDWQKEFVNSLEFNKLQEVQRAKHSSYGNLYMSPCAAAAAAAPMPAYAPAMSSASYSSAGQTAGQYAYSHTYPTIPSHKVGSSYYSYAHPYYRSEEDIDNDQEIMDFSDMNHAAAAHLPMARMNAYSYEAAPAAQVVATAGGSQAPVSGQIVGLFPNANVGGCSVPLLVSCSPSIVQGQIVKARPYYGSGSSNQGNSYRVVEDHHHHEEDEEYEETGMSSEHTTQEAKPSGHKHQ